MYYSLPVSIALHGRRTEGRTSRMLCVCQRERAASGRPCRLRRAIIAHTMFAIQVTCPTSPSSPTWIRDCQSWLSRCGMCRAEHYASIAAGAAQIYRCETDAWYTCSDSQQAVRRFLRATGTLTGSSVVPVPPEDRPGARPLSTTAVRRVLARGPRRLVLQRVPASTGADPTHAMANRAADPSKRSDCRRPGTAWQELHSREYNHGRARAAEASERNNPAATWTGSQRLQGRASAASEGGS
jgi:hypothetical protein